MTIELLSILCGMMGIFFIGMGFYCIYLQKKIIKKIKERRKIMSKIAEQGTVSASMQQATTHTGEYGEYIEAMDVAQVKFNKSMDDAKTIKCMASAMKEYVAAMHLAMAAYATATDARTIEILTKG